MYVDISTRKYRSKEVSKPRCFYTSLNNYGKVTEIYRGGGRELKEHKSYLNQTCVCNLLVSVDFYFYLRAWRIPSALTPYLW